MSKQTVFVSGATGYIAQHIIKQLLDTNQYRVIGSVRKGPKADKLKTDFNNNPNLSFVYVDDISRLDAFDKVFEEHGSKFDHILHTASPFHFNTTEYEKDLIIPAINGTKGIFEATVKHAPNVKKFVITSSHAAVRNSKQGSIKGDVITEKTWNNHDLKDALGNPVDAYCYSKKAAEKTAWDLHKSLNAKFSLTSINPAFVFGPQCFDSSVNGKLNTSCEMINSLIHGTTPEAILNTIKGFFIDVRDVARAHVDSITNSKLDGQRLVLTSDRFTLQSVADVLNKKFPELSGKIIKGTPGSDKDIFAELATEDNHVTKELLDFKFKTLTETVVDTASQILKVEAEKASL